MSAPNRLRSSGQIDAVRRRADNVDAAALEVACEVQRRLSAKLYDDAVGRFQIRDVEYVFGSERLEVEFVGSVVVGADGFQGSS